MHTLLGFFGVLARLLRPTRGAHTSPFGYLRELGFEARRNRSRRVRRYVGELSTTTRIEPEPLAPAPPVPAPSTTTNPSIPPAPVPPIPRPRRPIEDTSENTGREKFPQVEIVRGPYLAWESARKQVAA
ncbi:hypothetical protein [Nocardiopsis ganjiahuensis]|uniref:hypothetical protein n=1 Tax=Nocardiopsis ganjiahuensis TaxID=239984 RepID=UPI00034CD4F0|nr:hypothetical protein [Nocardiopsis ganjiahuensis]